jgi:hypothetical protein
VNYAPFYIARIKFSGLFSAMNEEDPLKFHVYGFFLNIIADRV